MGWKQPLEGLTKEQRGFIESFHMGLEPKPKKKKAVRDQRYYNPNDFITATPKEIEEQATQALELMKQNSDFREENIKANQWRGEL